MAELIAAGQLTEAEAEVDPRRSMITRALGLDPTVEVDLQDLETLGGDRVMFCSDGLTSMMRDPAIVAVLNEEPEPQLAAQRLIDEANKAGGVDNITVVIVDLAQGDDSETAQTENTSRRRWFRRQA
jgi:protein phosphatase